MFGETNSLTEEAHGPYDRDQCIIVPPNILEIVSERSEPDKMKMSSMKKLLFCALGIFICYFYYGIIQEKITKDKYGEAKEKFHYTLCLVFIQCVINGIFSYVVIRITRPPEDKTPSTLYATCSVSYLGAMLASNHALQHVNYPTQVLGKSCKPIPVMILGVLFARKRYTILKYLFVILIVAGVALFLYQDGKASTDHKIGWGELLLVISLILDGVTGATQERMRSDYHSNSNSMMLNVNIWSSLYLLVAIFLTGEVFTFSQFAQKYPHVLGNILTFSAASALGQYFIFFTVTEFGPLTCSIITTTRKLFTILSSVIIFNHQMTMRQWIGTAMVFVGLGLDSLYGKSARKK